MVEAATLCDGGCNPMWWRLQPYVPRPQPHVYRAGGGAAQGVRQGDPNPTPTPTPNPNQVKALHKECDKGMFSDFKEQVRGCSKGM